MTDDTPERIDVPEPRTHIVREWPDMIRFSDLHIRLTNGYLIPIPAIYYKYQKPWIARWEQLTMISEQFATDINKSIVELIVTDDEEFEYILSCHEGPRRNIYKSSAKRSSRVVEWVKCSNEGRKPKLVDEDRMLDVTWYL